jgi:antiviral helicase SKI2
MPPSGRRISGKLDVVPYADIMIITSELIKVIIHDFDFKIQLGDLEANREIYVEEIYEIAARLSSLSVIPEFDWTKIKELEFQEKLREKKRLLDSLKNFKCTKCPELISHVILYFLIIVRNDS